MKAKYWIQTLLFAMFFGLTACSKDNDPDVIDITPSLELTEDGYFDGIMYYQIISNSAKEVAISKVNKSATTVTIPQKVKIEGNTYKCSTIGENAFKECENLTSVVIPNSITSIRKSAFDGCISLSSVSIPNSVSSIEDYAFRSCKSITSLVIPDNVTYIGDAAFASCLNMTSITLPNNITSISKSMLGNCQNLLNITIPVSVTEIGSGAFISCESLTSISIPDNVRIIESLAFAQCNNLKTITIGKGIENIGWEAFYIPSRNMKDFYCYAVKVPQTDEIAFGGYYSFDGTQTLHVPNSSIEVYKNQSPWYSFKYIVGIDDTK